MFPGMNGIDPSKLSPQVIAEITDLMKTLSPDQIMRMQTLMHNTMAGLNTAKEMEEFEKSLPSTFRERMARIQYMAHGIEVPPRDATQTDAIQTTAAPVTTVENPKNENEARLVILHSVAGGLMAPEEALKILFP